MHNIRFITVVFLGSFLAACANKPPEKDYGAFNHSSPRSILIVPVINHSAEVEAGDLFLTTLPVPLAERGYYVFPVNLTKKLMENEGLADPYLVHSTATPMLGALFQADSVLYVEILDWKAQYAVTASNIVVKFLYTLKDGKTGDLLWQDERETVYSKSGNSGNILVDVIAAAVTSAIDNATADYTPVAVQANTIALLTDGQGIPYGPYSPNIEKNQSMFIATGTGHVSNATTPAVSFPVAAEGGE